LFVEDIEGHAILREKGNTPIAVGENLHMSYAFENFILRGAVDFVQPDVARAGGITEIRKITALAAKHGVPVSFHTWGDGRCTGGECASIRRAERLHRHGT
jgi:L-alanine-DL-glutamate epimerase-like enolase superfamily enzyme